MTTIETLRQDAAAKRQEHLALCSAYSTTLSWLTPANLILVIGAALLALVSGASVLIETSVLSKVQSGVLALVSAAFTVVHSKLGCEQYQTECKRLLSFHRGMSADYSNLSTIDDPEELRKRLTSLDEQVSSTLKSTTALPFSNALERAQARLVKK